MAEETATTDATAVARTPGEHNIAYQRLIANFPDASIRAGSMFGQDWAIVPASLVVDAVRLLRDDPALRFNLMVDLTAVDLLPRRPRWEVVYHFASLPRNTRYRLKVEVEDGPDPEVPSVTSIFRGANFYEREAFDLMGIRFSGHPNLTRILLPDDWQGYPLRFDHPLGGEEVGFTS